MAYLFPVALRGVGTADVEAFGTYIHRVADIHGISAGRLLAYVVSWHAAEHPELQHGLAGLHSTTDLCIYVRPNDTTRQLVEIFTHATGQPDLRCSTFLALQDAIDRSMNTFTSHASWCPACMREFEAAGDPGYFKLIWQLKAVTHCLTHRLPLRNTCAVCGSYQNGLGARSDCRTCKKCGSPLSEGYDVSSRPDSWESHGADLIELVELIANDATLAFPAKGVRGILSAIFDEVWNKEHERKFWELIPRDECISIVTGHQPVSLMTARRIAFRLGMHLSDLLAGKVTMTSEVLDPAWTYVLPQDMRPRKRQPPRDKDKVLERLRLALLVNNTAHPPALEVIARLAGVSVGYLHYHFPTIANTIIERHRIWEEERKQNVRLKARSAILAFFTSEKYAFERKSRKHALQVLRAETGLPKNVLRQEIATVLRVIGPTTVRDSSEGLSDQHAEAL